MRQRIRQQLQQRLPSLAQQLPDSERRNLQDMESAGLQSFGQPRNSDFFNSDSFRATPLGTDQRADDSSLLPDEGRIQQMPPPQQRDTTKVLDLQHA